MGAFLACFNAKKNDAPLKREKLMLQDRELKTEELKYLRRLKGIKSRMEKEDLPWIGRGATSSAVTLGKMEKMGADMVSW